MTVLEGTIITQKPPLTESSHIWECSLDLNKPFKHACRKAAKALKLWVTLWMFPGRLTHFGDYFRTYFGQVTCLGQKPTCLGQATTCLVRVKTSFGVYWDVWVKLQHVLGCIGTCLRVNRDMFGSFYDMFGVTWDHVWGQMGSSLRPINSTFYNLVTLKFWPRWRCGFQLCGDVTQGTSVQSLVQISQSVHELSWGRTERQTAFATYYWDK